MLESWSREHKEAEGGLFVFSEMERIVFFTETEGVCHAFSETQELQPHQLALLNGVRSIGCCCIDVC